MMERPELTGLGVAFIAHGALLYALSQELEDVRLPVLRADPIEVSFAEDVGLTSAAPMPSQVPPAASLAPELGPPEQAAPRPAEAVAPPPPDRTRLALEQKQKAAPPAQQKQKGNQKGAKSADRGRRFGAEILDGLNPDPSASRSNDIPASEMSAAARSSLLAEIRRQLKPHWKAPTGADAEKLRTELSVALARDGSVVSVEIVGTTGQTASNRPQVRLHQEQALRAVRLAAPFRLPPQFYDAWKEIRPAFDRRLSQ